MNISDVHLDLIAREILLRILEEGEIPSAETLVYLTDLRTEGLDLAQSEFAQEEPGVEYEEEASAGKFNKLSRLLVGDLAVLYRGFGDLEVGLSDVSHRTLLELQRLSRQTKDLISRANRLLLTTEKTGGLLNVVGDDFVDLEKVDEANTTAFVDLEGHTVHNQYFNSDELSTIDAFELSRLEESDVRITPLDPRIRRTPGTRDSVVNDILSESETPWIYTVTVPDQNSVGIEVRIDFTNAVNPLRGLVSTNKIVLDPYVVNNSLLVHIQHSMDGLIWEDIPVQDATRRVSGPTAYFVDNLEFLHLRIILTKDTHTRLDQEGGYVHDFGIRRLHISEVGSVYQQESELVSKQHIILDEEGNRKKFTKASLSVACEHIEPDTNIEYYIAFLDNVLSQGDYQRLVPLSREDANGPLVAEVDGILRTAATKTIDTTDPSFPGDTVDENYLLTGSVSTRSIEVWRNVGSNDRYYSVRQSDNRLVEGGWQYENGFYSTFVYVDTDGGLELDFGPTSIEVDGVRLTGLVRLSQGIHFIRTAEENWQSLEGLHSVVEFDELTSEFRGSQRKYGVDGFTIALTGVAEEVLDYRVIDRLYPYNHKLLIEGLDYSPNFAQDVVRQRYKGADRYAGLLMKRIDGADVENTIDALDYEKYAIVRAADNLVVSDRLLIKWKKRENTDVPREQFEVLTKTASFAEGLVFKAVFKTTNPRRSPSLDGYEIKVAE